MKSICCSEVDRLPIFKVNAELDDGRVTFMNGEAKGFPDSLISTDVISHLVVCDFIIGIDFLDTIHGSIGSFADILDGANGITELNIDVGIE